MSLTTALKISSRPIMGTAVHLREERANTRGNNNYVCKFLIDHHSGCYWYPVAQVISTTYFTNLCNNEARLPSRSVNNHSRATMSHDAASLGLELDVADCEAPSPSPPESRLEQKPWLSARQLRESNAGAQQAKPKKRGKNRLTIAGSNKRKRRKTASVHGSSAAGDCDEWDDFESSCYEAQHVSAMPPGPKSFEEVADLTGRYLERLVTDEVEGLTASENLSQAVGEDGTILLTDYSGIGSAEMESAIITSSAQQQDLPVDEGIVVWRSCDTDPHCRMILKLHEGPTKARHILPDILSRCPAEVVQDLRELLDKYLDQFNMKIQEPGAIKKDIVRELGREFMRQGWRRLQGVKMSAKAWCIRHKKLCPVYPPKTYKPNARRLWVGGNVCIPWSSVGDLMGWLHPVSIVFLVVMYELTQNDIDQIVQECVRWFDVEFLKELLSGHITFRHIIFSPIQQGIPTQRTREYAIGNNDKTMQEEIPFTIENFSKFFFRQLHTTAEIYFRASEEMVNKHLQNLADKQHLPLFIDGCRMKCQVLLTQGHRRRLQGYIKLGEEKNLDFICVDTNQRPEHFKSVNQVAPALLRSSRLYGFDLGGAQFHDDRTSVNSLEDDTLELGEVKYIDRCMLPMEGLAVQGIPVFLPDSKNYAHLNKIVKDILNIFGRLQEEAPRAVSSLCGNGMHLKQVGGVLLMALAGCHKVKPQTHRAPGAPRD